VLHYKLRASITFLTKGSFLSNYRLYEFGINSSTELILANHKPKPILNNIFKETIYTKEKQEVASFFGKKKRIDPNELRIDHYIIAHMTDAKIPAKRSKRRIAVILRLSK